MTDDLGKALDGAADAWRRAFRREMEGQGLSAGAASELLTHLPAAGLPQTALTQRAGLSKQAVQQLLDQLEAEGLVRREIDAADKRARQVRLTAAGQRHLELRHEVRDRLAVQIEERLGKKLSAKLDKAL
ncbi:MAG TPA: MarR family transcriptional regulator, partial [Devosia sp.]|nr:MarR family transcriptional regulator [Devosia sp.]